MKRSILSFSFIIGSIFSSSCSDNETQQLIPKSRVNFKINTNTTDNHLVSVGNIGIYIPHGDKSSYDKLIIGINGVKTFGAPRLSNEYIGYSGVLVINTGFSISGNTTFGTFDLCCPNERMQHVRVIPIDNTKVRCQQCNSVYDLFEGGRAVSGAAKNKGLRLQPYFISAIGQYEFRVFSNI